MFQLHEQLARDCVTLGYLPLCQLLLLNDANYPWFLLVPRREGVKEIFELADEDRSQLLAESCTLSRWLSESFEAHKLNVAALGNQVPQLHLHHIVRYQGDPAWPQPVWGRLAPRGYSEQAVAAMRARVVSAGLDGFAEVPL